MPPPARPPRRAHTLPYDHDQQGYTQPLAVQQRRPRHPHSPVKLQLQPQSKSPIQAYSVSEFHELVTLALDADLFLQVQHSPTVLSRKGSRHRRLSRNPTITRKHVHPDPDIIIAPGAEKGGGADFFYNEKFHNRDGNFTNSHNGSNEDVNGKLSVFPLFSFFSSVNHLPQTEFALITRIHRYSPVVLSA